MKVLLTSDNIGGLCTYTLNLAGGLKEKGIVPVIAVTGNPLNKYCSLYESLYHSFNNVNLNLMR
jgi:hypothetical protein